MKIFQSCAGFLEESGEKERGRSGERLFVVFFLVELRGIAETENLTVGVARQDAVRPLRFEGDDRHVPRTRPERGRYAAARQPLERFELEDGRRRLDVIEISDPAGTAIPHLPSPVVRCNLDASYLA